MMKTEMYAKIDILITSFLQADVLVHANVIDIVPGRVFSSAAKLHVYL